MNDKLRRLRISRKMTQERLAELINVSRQSIAKWENGDSIPDVLKCNDLARIFEVSIEDIVRMFTEDDDYVFTNPKGKYVFGILKLSENNTIIIPEEAKKVFNIKTGDSLLLLGDVNQGMALMPMNECREFIDQIMSAQIYGEEDKDGGNKNS